MSEFKSVITTLIVSVLGASWQLLVYKHVWTALVRVACEIPQFISFQLESTLCVGFVMRLAGCGGGLV